MCLKSSRFSSLHSSAHIYFTHTYTRILRFTKPLLVWIICSHHTSQTCKHVLLLSLMTVPLLCHTFKTIFSIWLKLPQIWGVLALEAYTFFLYHIYHFQFTYAGKSPFVTALMNPFATLSRRARTKQNNTALFQKDGSCQKLTWRKSPECNPVGTEHWLIHSSDSSAFGRTFWGSSNMTTLWSLFS